MNIDPGKREEIKKALHSAGLGDILLDRAVDQLAAYDSKSCDSGCMYGCEACCNSGTANRNG